MSCRTDSNASATTASSGTAIDKPHWHFAANSWGWPHPESSRSPPNPINVISTKNCPANPCATARSATLGTWWRSPPSPHQIGHRPSERHEMHASQSVPPSLRLLLPSQERGHVQGTKATTTFEARGRFSALRPRLPDRSDSTNRKYSTATQTHGAFAPPSHGFNLLSGAHHGFNTHRGRRWPAV